MEFPQMTSVIALVSKFFGYNKKVESKEIHNYLISTNQSESVEQQTLRFNRELTKSITANSNDEGVVVETSLTDIVPISAE
jgi:hypothetical protein